VVQAMRARELFPVPCRYSVVVPMHNEEGNVEPLATKLLAAMEPLQEPYELIFVDDGSSDATFERLARLAERHPQICIIKLKRNFGQTPALAAGFEHAVGEVILAMDGDQRSDPAEIPLLLEKLEEGYDVVNGWRRERSHDGFARTLSSRVANRWLAALSGVCIHDFGSTFKAYRREVIEALRLYGEQHRYLPVLAAWQGARIAEVPVSDAPRSYGKSHYGMGRMFRVPFDLLSMKFLRHFRSAPLHFFGVPGALSLLAGLGVYAYLGALALAKAPGGGHGWLVVMGAVLLLAGVQLLAVGFLGELLALSYFGPQHEPNYRVERIVGGAEAVMAETPARANAAGGKG
jgi:glycosyltransferase involved in cell wall biosynthesis